MADYVDWKDVLKEALPFQAQRDLDPPSIRILGEEDGFSLYQVGDINLYLPSSVDFHGGLPVAYREIFIEKVYEGGRCLVRPGDWVIDAGACEGFFSLYALRKGAKVIAFEPIPELAEALKKTLQSYIREGRAKVFAFGLGEKDEELEMFLFKDGVMSSTFSEDKVKHWHEGWLEYERLRLKVVSIDGLFKNGLLPPVSFIKADVEGYEKKLLLGASEVVRRFKPRLSICTYHLPDDYIEIPKIVEGFGLKYKIKLKPHMGTIGVMHAW